MVNLFFGEDFERNNLRKNKGHFHFRVNKQQNFRMQRAKRKENNQNYHLNCISGLKSPPKGAKKI